MPTGQKAGLRCDTLFASFSEPNTAGGKAKPAGEPGDGSDKSKAGGAMSPKFGPLKEFQAIGGVHLETARGHRGRTVAVRPHS
jgi:hypothetical protein